MFCFLSSFHWARRSYGLLKRPGNQPPYPVVDTHSKTLICGQYVSLYEEYWCFLPLSHQKFGLHYRKKSVFCSIHFVKRPWLGRLLLLKEPTFASCSMAFLSKSALNNCVIAILFCCYQIWKEHLHAVGDVKYRGKNWYRCLVYITLSAQVCIGLS